MLDEKWVTFELFPNYAISNYGTVLNVNRNRELNPSPDKYGYLRVALYRNGFRYDVYVHRLVAMAFFLNYENGVEVRHKNGDKTENTVLNLTLGVKRCRKGKDWDAQVLF